MNSSEEIKSYASTPQSLISFMEHSSDPWGIKDTESRWIYANNASLDFYNVEKGFNIEGRLDREIPFPAQEMWESLIECDNNCIGRNKRISSLEINYYGRNNTTTEIPSLCHKTPLYDDDNNIIGVIWRGEKIDNSMLLHYMHRLNRKTIQFDAPNDLFTKRELDIIFWAQQRLSAKEIARRLNLSPRTVENKLSLIYEKADVHSIIQLVEYCKDTGLDSYIPSDFIRKGVQLLE